MRSKVIFCIFAGVLATLLVGVVLNADDRRGRSGNLESFYDVKAQRSFEGIVAGQGHIIDGLMYLPIETGDTVFEALLGPKRFLGSRTLIFKRGDMVVVVGVPIVHNERRVVLAREISGMNGTLVLRGDDGVRYSTPTRSERIR